MDGFGYNFMGKLQLYSTDQEGHFIVSGMIGPDADLSSLLESPSNHLVLNLKEITEITSIGIKKWVESVRVLLDNRKSLEYDECSEIFMHQCNFVLELAQGVGITSFQVTFMCDECDIYEVKLLKTNELSLEYLPPLFNCPTCGRSMEVEEDDTFNFLKEDRR